MSTARFATLACLFAGMLSCKANTIAGPGGGGGGGGGGTVDTVTIVSGNFSLAKGTTSQLQVLTKDNQGTVLTGKIVNWSSLDLTIATVNSSGVVTGVNTGVTKIIASVAITGSTRADTVDCTVTGLPVASITVSPPNATINSGDSLQLTATAKDINGATLTNVVFTWSSTNVAVATVSNLGLVRANGTGTDTIKATSGLITGTTVVVVQTTPVSTVTVTPGSGSLAVGGATLQLTAVARDVANNIITGRPVTWTSSNTSVATVSTTGLVTTGLSFGGANISATVGGVSGIAGFNVVLQFTAIGANGISTCGTTTFGAAYCWGSNLDGQFGNGTIGGSVFGPTPVVGAHVFRTVDVGFQHACGVTGPGQAFCWGSNGSGQLGDGTNTPRLIPTLVTGGQTFDSLSLTAGASHNCALTTAGAAYCWGDNTFGQIGDGTFGPGNNRSAPTLVSGGLTFSMISAGDAATCGVATGGAGYCWGDNASGQVGDNTSGNIRTVPTLVSGGLTFASVTTGGTQSCGVTTNGGGFCWGGNGFGELGKADQNPSSTPVPIFGGQAWASINAGTNTTCGITQSGTINGGAIYCWGDDQHWQIGSPDTSAIFRTTPTASAGPTSTIVSVGFGHVCSVTSGFVAFCWGFNSEGQVGDNAQNPPASPARGVQIPTKVIGQP